jgi:hypothetical protein
MFLKTIAMKSDTAFSAEDGFARRRPANLLCHLPTSPLAKQQKRRCPQQHILRSKPARCTLEQYAGTYELQPGFDLVVTVENGQLMTQATGQPKFQVYAESDTEFFPLDFPAEIEFVRTDGKVSAIVLHQGGHDMKAPRK